MFAQSESVQTPTHVEGNIGSHKPLEELHAIVSHPSGKQVSDLYTQAPVVELQ